MENIKKNIISTALRLHQKNLLASADGNISFRLSEEEIIITPSGKNKSLLTIEDLAVINIKNEILAGQPSSERLMHLEIYKSSPQCRCVVHAHPPSAIALSLSFPEWKTLPAEYLSELILAVGDVPIVPYARPGTLEMGTALRSYLPQHRVLILSRHGGISWGEDLEEAYNGMERLEHVCQIFSQSFRMGNPRPLPLEEVQYLREVRKKLGDRTL